MTRHEAALRLLLLIRPRPARLPDRDWDAQWQQALRAVDPGTRADYQTLARTPQPLFGYHPAAVSGSAALAVIVAGAAALLGYRETSAAGLFCLTLTPLLSHVLYHPQRAAARRHSLLFTHGVIGLQDDEQIDFAEPDPRPVTTHTYPGVSGS